MIRLTRTQPQPIGLDIGFDTIRMVQLQVVGSSLSVLAAARAPMPPEARQDPSLRLPLAVEVIRRMLRNNGFYGRHVVTALPREMVHVKNLRLPHLMSEELAQAVSLEASNLFPFDPASAHIRYIHAGEIRQGGDVRDEVIVLGALKEDVDNYVETLHRCGLVIDALDFEPCAIYRSVERFVRRREDENEVNVLVEIGARCTQVVIGKGREINFFKSIDIGTITFDQAVAQKLGVTQEEAAALRRRSSVASGEASSDPVLQAVFDATRASMEELVRELALCLRYYSVTFRGQRPGRIRLAGGGACDAQLRGILSALLPVPVEVARPLLSVDCSMMKPADRRGYMSEWTVALGLGLKCTTGYFGPRDGRQRDPEAPRPDLVESSAQVIDLSKAVREAETVGSSSGREAVHA